MDVIEMARDLGRVIQQDDRFVAFKFASDKNDADEILQQRIEKFNMLRVEINREVSKAEKDQPKLSALDAQFKELYKNIMEMPTMLVYTAAKNEMDSMLQFINQIIMASANGQNPDDIEQATACSGSCDSCGGCSN